MLIPISTRKNPTAHGPLTQRGSTHAKVHAQIRRPERSKIPQLSPESILADFQRPNL
jgi:hypothetical protein